MTRFCPMLLLLCATTCPAQQTQTWFSYDASTVVDGSLVVRRGDIVIAPESISVSGVGDVEVTALHLDDDNALLFAVATATTLPGGALARPNDVIRWHDNSFELIFAGEFAAANLRGVAIDAITRDALGRLVLSFDASTGIAGFVLSPAGLYATSASGGLHNFDPVPVFDPVAAGIPAGVNLDAAHYAVDAPFPGFFLLSFDQTIGIFSGLLPVLDHQVALFDGAGNALGLANVPDLPADPDSDDHNVDLNALWYGAIAVGDDRIFANDFELQPESPGPKGRPWLIRQPPMPMQPTPTTATHSGAVPHENPSAQ